MYKEIYISGGYICLVSEEDYTYLNQFNWGSNVHKNTIKVRRVVNEEAIYIHQEVIKRVGLIVPYNRVIDHIDRNGLNNQRDNLRIVTKSVNSHNINIPSNNRVGVKGIYFNSRTQKWVVQIKVRGVRHYIGSTKDLDEAIKMREEAEIRFKVI